MVAPRALVRVVTASQAAARDAAAISAGIPSRNLMQRAGAGTADQILRHFNPSPDARMIIFAGSGNNGGDGWVVAGALAERGFSVDVCAIAPPNSDDARAAQVDARHRGGEKLRECSWEQCRSVRYAVAVDALLGTGATGAPRGGVPAALDALATLRAVGSAVAAVDLPTGLDADTGRAEHAVPADLTVTYGTVKRGHLISRGLCGHVVVLDIGLGAHADLPDGAPWLVDEAWVAEHVPVIHADAHKGTRGKLAIVGGGPGMSGAVILAARAALRSGAGMVKVLAEATSLDAIRAAEPAVLTAEWSHTNTDIAADIGGWADALVIGPGLGNSPQFREMVERFLKKWNGPVVLDADALNVFAGERAALAKLLARRPAVLTPHAAEFARLASTTVPAVLESRFEIGRELAAQLGAAVLLKGTPTVIFDADGERRMVSASGTPVLATGGSGDVLSGITGTLLAQSLEPFTAAACGAWVHGHAAELVQFAPGDARRDARGLVLDDVVQALREAWRISSALPPAPVLAELPAVEGRA